jgi:hypothetical protein
MYMTQLCDIKYHGVMMLLLRPSPAIPSPSVDSLKLCYESAVASIGLYDQLYKRDLLVYSWVTVHSIFLSTITLHCIWTVPEVCAQIKLDMLMADLKEGSNVLSATGEHWSEAKRSRDVLDELSGTTIRWIIESRARNVEIRPRAGNSRRGAGCSSRNRGAGASRPAHIILVVGCLQQSFDFLDLGLEVVDMLLLAQAENALRDAGLVAPLLRWDVRLVLATWQGKAEGQFRRGRLALAFSVPKLDREDRLEVEVEFWRSFSMESYMYGGCHHGRR